MVPDVMLHMHRALAVLHRTARSLPLLPPGASPRATNVAIGLSRRQCASCGAGHHPCHANALNMRIEVHVGARNSQMCFMCHGWHAARGRLEAGGGPLGWSHEPSPYPWSSPPGTAIQRSSNGCKSAQDTDCGSSLTPIPEPWMSLGATLERLPFFFLSAFLLASFSTSIIQRLRI